ncbi:hypothetical protein ZWY2020_001526 [Hordeum vulgare]|nr:hypothetical protein ZWY2020_001526 [Hordeum vulgare]
MPDDGSVKRRRRALVLHRDLLREACYLAACSGHPSALGLHEHVGPRLGHILRAVHGGGDAAAPERRREAARVRHHPPGRQARQHSRRRQGRGEDMRPRVGWPCPGERDAAAWQGRHARVHGSRDAPGEAGPRRARGRLVMAELLAGKPLFPDHSATRPGPASL